MFQLIEKKLSYIFRRYIGLKKYLLRFERIFKDLKNVPSFPPINAI